MPNPHLFVGFAVATLASLVLGSPASAQNDDLVLRLSTPSFVESLLPTNEGRSRATPNGSDPLRTIVGIHYGHSSKKFDIAQLGAFMQGSANRRTFCVTINSYDGRYSANNLYYNSADPRAARFVETRSTHASELAQIFDADSVAVRIIANATCDNATSGQLVAAIPPGKSGDGSANGARDDLVVYLNADDVARFGLLAGGKVITETACKRTAMSVRAFSHVCEIPMARITTRPDMVEVQTRSGTQWVPTRYPLLWNAQ